MRPMEKRRAGTTPKQRKTLVCRLSAVGSTADGAGLDAALPDCRLGASESENTAFIESGVVP